MGKHTKSKLGEKFCEKSNGGRSVSEIDSSFGKLLKSEVVPFRAGVPMHGGWVVISRWNLLFTVQANFTEWD